MLTARRLYIASMDAERIERAFLQEKDFCVTGAAADGPRAVAEIRRLQPDTVVLDGVLRGMDGPAALKSLSEEAAPPRVAYLYRTEAAPGEIEIDAAAPYPYDRPEEIVALARKAARNALPLLARPWEAFRLEAARRLTERLGINPRLIGQTLVCFAASALACAPYLASSCRTALYPYLAEACHTTAGAAERAIRTAVEDTWLRGNLDEIQRLFGLTVDAEKGKPTNKEFLTQLADHIRRDTSKAMIDI